MFELWLVTEGSGEGELLLLDVGAKEDLPPQLRRRTRQIGPGPFTTEAEARQFRQKYLATQAVASTAEHGRSLP